MVATQPSEFAGSILQIPDFFLAGAPKCGTTSLHSWLSQHRDIHAPRKEPNFFSQDIYPTHGRIGHIASLQEYSEIFDKERAGKAYSCDATPKYLYSDNALREIKRLRPAAKIVLCLRDPVNLAISLHGQKLRESIETDISFERAWMRCYSSSSNIIGDRPEIDGKINYLFWSSFGVRLQRLHQIFPRESILILLDHEMKLEPRSAYLKVLNFIGLEDDGRTNFPVENIRTEYRSYRLNKMIHWARKKGYPVVKYIRALRGGRAIGVGQFVNKFNKAPSATLPPISSDFRARMYDLLKDDIRLAESFLDGRNLSSGRVQIKEE